MCAGILTAQEIFRRFMTARIGRGKMPVPLHHLFGIHPFSGPVGTISSICLKSKRWQRRVF
jgi:hypothetical protein